MFGSIGGYSYSPYYSNAPVQNTHNTVPPSAAQPQAEVVSAPVQPVPPTREIISNGAKFSIESMLNQHASDPVAMSVRMRIQQPGQSEDAAQQLPADEIALPTAEAESPQEEETVPVQDEESKSALETVEENECQTCENRKYQDGSDDPGVSFKTATKLSPEEAATAVRGHEMEHVVREQAKAEREDRRVISQNVTIRTAICPECGTVYASGGTTTTVTKADPSEDKQDETSEEGQDNASAAA